MSTNCEENEKVDKQRSKSAEQPGSSPEPDTRAEETQDTSSPDSVAATPQWQAIWAPQYNSYYFYNHITQETTWTNPLQPEEGSSSSVSADQTPSTEEHSDENAAASTTGLTYSTASSKYAALQAAAIAQGIDPALAHLDPTLGASLPGTSNIPGGTFGHSFCFIPLILNHLCRCAHLYGTV
jgi:hypothetical protein